MFFNRIILKILKEMVLSYIFFVCYGLRFYRSLLYFLNLIMNNKIWESFIDLFIFLKIVFLLKIYIIFESDIVEK